RGELRADPVDVLEGVIDLLAVGDVNACDTWHGENSSDQAGADQPWTCLCLGLALQMTRTRPLRRMTWHWPQILLTLLLTFMTHVLSRGARRRAGVVPGAGIVGG